jgi:two-component system NtrC family sensor kinase
VAFVVLQSSILTNNFTRAFYQAEHLRKNLQEEVTLQTAELRETSDREIQHAKTLLNKNEKLSQLGVMIAGIGHEIVNPVSVISNGLPLQEEALTTIKQTLGQSKPQQIEKALDKLELTHRTNQTSVHKLLEITNALRTQSRQEPLPTDGVCVNEIIKEAIILTAGRIFNTELTQDLGTIPLIQCYRSKVGQVVINLLVNASDAAEARHTEQRDNGVFERRKIKIQSQQKSRDDIDGISIVVSDSGRGVPETLQGQIFDQFFTTKGPGKGTGLGLAMCAEIAQEHRGSIDVTNDSEFGGASFELWIPCSIPS